MYLKQPEQVQHTILALMEQEKGADSCDAFLDVLKQEELLEQTGMIVLPQDLVWMAMTSGWFFILLLKKMPRNNSVN